MKGIINDTGYLEGAVNISNTDEFLPFLPGNIAVEVPAVIDAQGLHGQEITTLPKGIQSLLRHEAVVSDLGVEAALTGDRSVALQALLADGTCPTPEIAENILNTMLEKQRKYLPQFFP
jgi:alpha-galactosidase/6-phospho-beta-glucosidase family protein